MSSPCMCANIVDLNGELTTGYVRPKLLTEETKRPIKPCEEFPYYAFADTSNEHGENGEPNGSTIKLGMKSKRQSDLNASGVGRSGLKSGGGKSTIGQSQIKGSRITSSGIKESRITNSATKESRVTNSAIKESRISTKSGKYGYGGKNQDGTEEGDITSDHWIRKTYNVKLQQGQCISTEDRMKPMMIEQYVGIHMVGNRNQDENSPGGSYNNNNNMSGGTNYFGYYSPYGINANSGNSKYTGPGFVEPKYIEVGRVPINNDNSQSTIIPSSNKGSTIKSMIKQSLITQSTIKQSNIKQSTIKNSIIKSSVIKSIINDNLNNGKNGTNNNNYINKQYEGLISEISEDGKYIIYKTPLYIMRSPEDKLLYRNYEEQMKVIETIKTYGYNTGYDNDDSLLYKPNHVNTSSYTTNFLDRMKDRVKEIHKKDGKSDEDIREDIIKRIHSCNTTLDEQVHQDYLAETLKSHQVITHVAKKLLKMTRDQRSEELQYMFERLMKLRNKKQEDDQFLNHCLVLQTFFRNKLKRRIDNTKPKEEKKKRKGRSKRRSRSAKRRSKKVPEEAMWKPDEINPLSDTLVVNQEEILPKTTTYAVVQKKKKGRSKSRRRRRRSGRAIDPESYEAIIKNGIVAKPKRKRKGRKGRRSKSPKKA